jgi:hypothetical protein
MEDNNLTNEQMANIFGYALHLATTLGGNAISIFDELIDKYSKNVNQFYEDTKDIEFTCGRGENVD